MKTMAKLFSPQASTRSPSVRGSSWPSQSSSRSLTLGASARSGDSTNIRIAGDFTQLSPMAGRKLPAMPDSELAEVFLPVYDVSDAVAAEVEAERPVAWQALL